MIVTFMAGDTVPGGGSRTGRPRLDIMVNPEQRLEDVCRRVSENGFLPPVCSERQIRVYSMRRRAYVNPMLTFRQGEIYTGDILAVYY